MLKLRSLFAVSTKTILTQGSKSMIIFTEKFYSSKELSTEFLIEDIKLVVLENYEFDYQDL